MYHQAPLVFNVFLCDLFLFKSNIDYHPFAMGGSSECRGKTYFVVICNKKFSSACSEKFWGTRTDNKLTFEEHVEGLCKNASQKFSVVARISSLKRFEQRKRIVNLFITSHFSYCPLVWIFHNRLLNNRIDHIHERTYQDYNSSFKGLLRKRQLLDINVFIKCQTQKSFRILLKILLTTEAATGDVLWGKVFIEILQNSQENTLVRVCFLIKLQASVYNFIKNKTLVQVFFCEFCEISKNTFFTEHLWLLLYWNFDRLHVIWKT